MTAILPCSDLQAAQSFFERLGFRREAGSPDDYRVLYDGLGGRLPLSQVVEGWLDPERNPFGLYLHREDVDSAAAAFPNEIIEKEGSSQKPWGMYEFALNGPDNVLVRVGWPVAVTD